MSASCSKTISGGRNQFTKMENGRWIKMALLFRRVRITSCIILVRPNNRQEKLTTRNSSWRPSGSPCRSVSEQHEPICLQCQRTANLVDPQKLRNVGSVKEIR